MGVMLIANPLNPNQAAVGSGHVDDHIPVDPIHKLLGLAFAIPSTLVIGTEGISHNQPTDDR